MRNVVLGGFVGAGVMAAVCGWWNFVETATAAPREVGQLSGQDLITLSREIDEQREQLTVIDPQQRVISIYHVARDTGEISLKSVRKIQWDLQMEEFNSASPRPREVRVALEQP